MWSILAEVVSAALIVAGIAFIFWPASLVVAGAFGLWAMSRAAA